MELEGKAQIEGLWADRSVGLGGVRSDIATMRTPDGHSKLELAKYHAPAAISAEPDGDIGDCPDFGRFRRRVPGHHHSVATG